MKYLVDPALCSGRGSCAVAAPEVFVLDDEGYNRDVGATVPVGPGREQAVENGAAVCPEQAIRVMTA